MGIALLTLADLLTPLQAIASRWMPTRAGRAAAGTAGLRYVAVRPSCTARTSTVGAAASRPQRVVRVVRVVDGGSAKAPVGRVVISGRMADVCAELDRLAALEALGHAGGDAIAPPQLH